MPESAPLQHHFEDLDQQKEAVTIGMWIFLATEVLFFGGLFAGYAVYHYLYPQAFAEASRLMSVGWGALNTFVLLTSSLTVALAVRAARMQDQKQLVRFLCVTLVLGLLFLLIKSVEYHHKFAHHLFPGVHFRSDSPNAPQVQLFFVIYFAMTGLHALHVIIGLGILSTMLILARRGRLTGGYSTPMHLSGLYWHFVDIVWIFLFPLLYLVGGR